MKLFDYISKCEFEHCVSAGYINVNYHPTVEGLRIICYTQLCNSDKYWNDTTIKCRGLIVDKDDNIIARPFPKFFNYEEHEEYECLSNIDFIDGLAGDFKPEIYEKLDGSLGILYWVDDTPYIATKGSFTSEQSIHATHLLHTKYRNTWGYLMRNKTYLFEIIYPEDSHIVNYKDIDDIFLLAIISTNNNFEYPIELMKEHFPVAKKYYINDWKHCREIINGDNREGFVIRIGSLRIKMKYKEYWRLHYLKNCINEKKILKHLINNEIDILNDAFELFDEEQRMYYNSIVDKYQSMYDEIYNHCISYYRDDFETQKDAALYFNTCKYPQVLFAMRQKNNDRVKNIIWKCVSNNL